MSGRQTALILPFARPARPDNRMTLRDRSDALGWSVTARDMGYTRIAFDSSAADNEPELGDFMLIYARDAMWASWGVGCCEGGFIVWRPADGQTMSWHPTIRRALAAIPAVDHPAS